MKCCFVYITTWVLWTTNILVAGEVRNETTVVEEPTETIIDFTSIDHIEHSLFYDVLVSCSADVETFCPYTNTTNDDKHRRRMIEDTIGSSFGNNHHTLIEEFDTFVNSFIRPNDQWVVVGTSTGSVTGTDVGTERLEESTNKKVPCPKLVSTIASIQNEHEFIHNFAINFHPSQYHVVSQQLQSHGNALLTVPTTPAANDSTNNAVVLSDAGLNIARRLSTITPKELLFVRNSFLPFYDIQNTCIERMYQYNPDQLTSNCRMSLSSIHEYRTNLHIMENKKNIIFIIFLSFTFGTFILLVILYYTKTSKWWQKNKDDSLLREIIITLVYNQPTIKKMIEEKAGVSIGFEPPFLARIRTSYIRLKKTLKEPKKENTLGEYVVSVLLVSFVFLWNDRSSLVFWQLFYTCIFVLTVYSLYTNDKVAEPICTCCCCQMTTDMAKLGTGSEEQACCKCCNGTGVCNLSCSSCCSPSSMVKETKFNDDLSCATVTTSCSTGSSCDDDEKQQTSSSVCSNPNEHDCPLVANRKDEKYHSIQII